MPSSVSDNTFVGVKNPIKILEVGMKEGQRPNSNKGVRWGPIFEKVTKATIFEKTFPRTKGRVDGSMFIIIEKVTRKNKSNGSVVRSKSLVKYKLKNFAPQGKVLLFSATHNSGTVSQFLLNNARNHILPRGLSSTRAIVQDSVKNVMTVSKHGFKVMQSVERRNRERNPKVNGTFSKSKGRPSGHVGARKSLPNPEAMVLGRVLKFQERSHKHVAEKACWSQGE